MNEILSSVIRVDSAVFLILYLSLVFFVFCCFCCCLLVCLFVCVCVCFVLFCFVTFGVLNFHITSIALASVTQFKMYFLFSFLGGGVKSVWCLGFICMFVYKVD